MTTRPHLVARVCCARADLVCTPRVVARCGTGPLSRAVALAAIVAGAGCPLLRGPEDIKVNVRVIVLEVPAQRGVHVVVAGADQTQGPLGHDGAHTFELADIDRGDYDGAVTILDGATPDRCGTFQLHVGDGDDNTAVLDGDDLASCTAAEGEGEGGEGEGVGEGEGEGVGEGEGDEGEGDEGEGEGVSDDPPQVRIIEPEDREIFASGASINFACAAFDDADGFIVDDAAFAWTRDDAPTPFLLGAVGQAAMPADGDYTLRCHARDSDGNTGSASVDVCVGTECHF